MRLSVDVVVPTFNGWTLTESCLRHLLQQDFAAHIIVVDNGSTDGTPGRVAERFPQVQVVRNPINRGFGAACNAGIAAGRGDIVVLVNNDVDAPPGFLRHLTAPLERDSRLGSVAGLLVRPDGAIDSCGLVADVTLAGFPRLQGRRVAEAIAASPALIGPSGGAAAYRRAALNEVGPFDERIFLYQEDLDLALRLRAAGWGSAVAANTPAVHHGSATAGRRSAWQRRHAGFARGYLLRRYRVLRSRAALRALATEAIVAAGDLLISRDAAAFGGRAAGWRAARGLPPRLRPADGLDRNITFAASLRLRRADYAIAAGATSLRSTDGGAP